MRKPSCTFVYDGLHLYKETVFFAYTKTYTSTLTSRYTYTCSSLFIYIILCFWMVKFVVYAFALIIFYGNLRFRVSVHMPNTSLLNLGRWIRIVRRSILFRMHLNNKTFISSEIKSKKHYFNLMYICRYDSCVDILIIYSLIFH